MSPDGGVVVGAPVLAFAGAGISRRSLLLGLMGFYAIGNLASALAPNYHTMLLARFVAGLPHGAYFGVAMLVAASISPPAQRGAAVSKVLLGLSIAILVGNPLTTWLGQQFTWRTAFALVSLLALATVVVVSRHLAPDPNAHRRQFPQSHLRPPARRCPSRLLLPVGRRSHARTLRIGALLHQSRRLGRLSPPPRNDRRLASPRTPPRPLG